MAKSYEIEINFPLVHDAFFVVSHLRCMLPIFSYNVGFEFKATPLQLPAIIGVNLIIFISQIYLSAEQRGSHALVIVTAIAVAPQII